MSTPSMATCLWFDGKAGEAARFYVETFRACGREAGIDETVAATPSVPGETGRDLLVFFTLDGAAFQGLNGGPDFQFTHAVSLSVVCRDQAEIDAFWSRLGEGGQEIECGWLTDRYGLSWQIVPRRMMEMMKDPDRSRADRAFRAMMTMKKFDVAALERAYAGEES